ncbi:hypothetical protein ILUMI_23303 [Ignelater luminosus]|uniref:Protein HGH1 homolog n=1 Tax=Ignelater luminosus TaxID=2038154 RepID=A0A8K0CCK4_IGNLU|nr:hypothetical protein ILUMI_23303 [Ignelater luminosus]
MEKQIQEIIPFLSQDDRPDIQFITLQNILALSGNAECLKLMNQQEELLITLLSLLKHSNVNIAKNSALILVNISADINGADALLKLNNSINKNDLLKERFHVGDPIWSILKSILDSENVLADPCCMVLSNLTRPKQFLELVLDLIEKCEITYEQIVNVFTKNKYNQKGQNLYYLGPVLSNLSQSARVRKYILNKDKCVVQRLLPFTEFEDSVIKRGGVIGTLRNCCFETEYHEWLLSDEVDILPRLLLPLADNTEFDEEDNDKLPSELQFLPDDKTREGDPDIRCMLLEAITQLCALRKNRESIRSKNTYVILRELHKWEKDKKSLLACENLVDILIRTEEEIGEDNLKDVEVPPDLQEKFDQVILENS